MPTRKFENQKVSINDVEFTVGVHVADDGAAAIKIRLPSGDWVLSQLFRGTDTALSNGKHAVAVFDMDAVPKKPRTRVRT